MSGSPVTRTHSKRRVSTASSSPAIGAASVVAPAGPSGSVASDTRLSSAATSQARTASSHTSLVTTTASPAKTSPHSLLRIKSEATTAANLEPTRDADPHADRHFGLSSGKGTVGSTTTSGTSLGHITDPRSSPTSNTSSHTNLQSTSKNLARAAHPLSKPRRAKTDKINPLQVANLQHGHGAAPRIVRAQELEKSEVEHVPSRHWPADVIRTVLTFFFIDEALQNAPAYRSRLNCLLVNRTFAQVGLPLFYADIYLSTSGRVKAFAKRASSTSHPHIGPWVWRLCLDGLGECQCLENHLPSILDNCASVRSLAIVGCYPVPIWQILYAKFGSTTESTNESISGSTTVSIRPRHFEASFMAVEAQGCCALLSALGPEVETLKMRDLRMVTSEAIKLVAPIWRMNAFTPLARPPFVPTGGLRELTLADGHVSAAFMFAITHDCPSLKTLVVEPWVYTINHRLSVVQLDMARFIQSLNPDTLRKFYWGGGIPLTEAAASAFDTILDILPGLQELGVPLKFFSLVLAQTLSNSKLQRLTLIPSSRVLGGIDAPALVARSEEIVRALGVAMVEFSSSGVEWEARNGVDSFIGYESVKRMLALAKARFDAGVRYEEPLAAKA